MPSNCAFILNKQPATYFSGETISGTVTLNTTSDKNVREVCIIFLGEGKVKWNESHTTRTGNGNTTTTTTHYRAHEIYINNSTKVYDDGVLRAGTYNFTFNIPLPWDCPTSLEGKFGNIRYEISLKINRYYRFDNIYKKPVTIIKTVDLNLYPIFKVPIVFEDNSSSCCWPCSRGNIFYKLKVPFGAYASGQIVSYTLQITNRSMDDVEGYSLVFSQKVTFHSRTPHHKQRHTKKVLVSRQSTDKCLRLSNRLLEGTFCIPATPPTTNRSSIICVEYSLKVTVQLSCCKRNPDLKLPIVIGTIPIRESLAGNQLLNNAEEQPFLASAPEILPPESEGMNSNKPPNYLEELPPTFEEATGRTSPFVDTDIDERNRITGFKPLYPCYNTTR